MNKPGRSDQRCWTAVMRFVLGPEVKARSARSRARAFFALHGHVVLD
jgi:hypothetical protein